MKNATVAQKLSSPPPRIQIIRIATRESPLALWQANYVSALIQKKYPQVKVEIVAMTTRGDQILDKALSKVGGKGLFIKELEQALLDNRADIAVHSLKDVPMQLSPEFEICAMLPREVANDALVSNLYSNITQFPEGAVIGTSSLRRQAVLRKYYPHLKIKLLRGNLGTRLRKLDEGEYTGIILACAGLIRMQKNERITEKLCQNIFLPAPGQGVVAIETLKGQNNIYEFIKTFADENATLTCTAERAFAEVLQGGCEVPLAVHATIDYPNSQLIISAFVADIEGDEFIEGKKMINLPQNKFQENNFDKINQDLINLAKKTGNDLANEFIDKGAMAIISKIKQQ